MSQRKSSAFHQPTGEGSALRPPHRARREEGPGGEALHGPARRTGLRVEPTHSPPSPARPRGHPPGLPQPSRRPGPNKAGRPRRGSPVPTSDQNGPGPEGASPRPRPAALTLPPAASSSSSPPVLPGLVLLQFPLLPSSHFLFPPAGAAPGGKGTRPAGRSGPGVRV